MRLSTGAMHVCSLWKQAFFQRLLITGMFTYRCCLFPSDQPTDKTPVTSPTDSVEPSDNEPASAESAISLDIPVADSDEEAFESLRILASLTGFEIKLFKGEPKLVKIIKI